MGFSNDFWNLKLNPVLLLLFPVIEPIPSQKAKPEHSSKHLLQVKQIRRMVRLHGW